MKRVPESEKDWFDVVNHAAEFSSYNFENKRALLMAEKLSLSCEDEEAAQMYDAAIQASKSSHFIHEEVRSDGNLNKVLLMQYNLTNSFSISTQGLSCELAGAHYEKMSNFTKALELYEQAELCYEVWGSVVKTHHMTKKVNALRLKCQ
jgi:hypothetical protein